MKPTKDDLVRITDNLRDKGSIYNIKYQPQNNIIILVTNSILVDSLHHEISNEIEILKRKYNIDIKIEILY